MAVRFLSATSGLSPLFGPKSNARSFLTLHLKLFGAISSREVNQ